MSFLAAQLQSRQEQENSAHRKGLLKWCGRDSLDKDPGIFIDSSVKMSLQSAVMVSAACKVSGCIKEKNRD